MYVFCYIQHQECMINDIESIPMIFTNNFILFNFKHKLKNMLWITKLNLEENKETKILSDNYFIFYHCSYLN